MSVLIKGMDMPKSCYKCPLRRRDGMDIVCPVAHERFSVADVNILEYRLNNCPLVPVQPHGRLIDADALEYHADNVRDPMGRTEKTVMWKKIESAQTILQAEEGEA